MGALPTSLGPSLALGLRQLFDGAVLRVLLKSVAVSIVLFVLVATAGWFLLDWLLAWSGLGDELFAGAGALRGLLSLALSLLGLWLTWRVVAMAVVQFYADEVVQAVEARHYPGEAVVARDLPVGEQFAQAFKSAGRALLFNLLALPFALVLLVTGIGTFVLFWFVNALLLGRELQDMVWLRHAHAQGKAAPVSRTQRFLLGGLIAALMAVPFVNFLAPVLGATSATHLVHRNLRLHQRRPKAS